MRLVVRLARRELSRRPAANLAGAFAGAAAGAALARKTHGGPVPLAPLAAVVLVMAAGALASATDPTQRDEADLLVRQGCPRTILRLANWLAAAATVGVTAALAAVVASAIPGGSFDRLSTALFAAATLPATGAWVTAGSVLPERTGSNRRSKGARSAARAIVGLLLVLGGAAFPTGSRSGADLDLSLSLGAILVLAGFALLSPTALGMVAWPASRLPRPAVRVGASAVARNRRGLTMTVTLLAAVACLLVVQAVVGEGLGRREADRRSAVASLGPATTAGSDRLVLLETTRLTAELASDASAPSGTSGPGGKGSDDNGPGGSDHNGSHPDRSLLDEARLAAPGAAVADFSGVALTVRSGRAVYGAVRDTSGLDRDASSPVDVAVATPQVLATLGLDPALAQGARAVVLDARVLRPDRSVLIGADPFVTSSHSATEPAEPIRIPAADAWPRRVPARLPAVLLPERLVPSGTPVDRRSDRLVVVRFPNRPSDRQVRKLSAAIYADVTRGEIPVDVIGTHRSDRISTVWVRDRADSWRLLGAILVLSATAALVALLGLRLAVRREDEVLSLLGAGSRMQGAVSAVRGTVIGVVGAVLGGAIGLIGTAMGLARYNARGRFQGADPLARIAFSWPPTVWLGLLALPALTAAVGALLALGNRLRPNEVS